MITNLVNGSSRSCFVSTCCEKDMDIDKSANVNEHVRMSSVDKAIYWFTFCLSQDGSDQNDFISDF